jgi:hypothetical protein
MTRARVDGVNFPTLDPASTFMKVPWFAACGPAAVTARPGSSGWKLGKTAAPGSFHAVQCIDRARALIPSISPHPDSGCSFAACSSHCLGAVGIQPETCRSASSGVDVGGGIYARQESHPSSSRTNSAHFLSHRRTHPQYVSPSSHRRPLLGVRPRCSHQHNYRMWFAGFPK